VTIYQPLRNVENQNTLVCLFSVFNSRGGFLSHSGVQTFFGSWKVKTRADSISRYLSVSLQIYSKNE